MAELISIREYSRRKGCSDTAVHKAIAAGKIVKGLVKRHGKKFINPEIADAEWSSNHNPSYGKVNKSGKEMFTEGEAPPQAPAGAGQKVPNVSDGTLAAAKKAKAVYDAQLAKLDFEQKSGKLVPKADVYKALYAAGQELRISLMAIPDRVIDDILSAPSRNEAHQLLVNELSSTLETLNEIQNREITTNR